MKPIKHVLLIDDDKIVNLINTKVIQLSVPGASVSSVTNGYEALRILKDAAQSGTGTFPDLIFLDINMPEMDGWEFLEELGSIPENALSQCRIIMLTSSIDLLDIKKAKKNIKVNDYIIKPLDLEVFKLLSSSEHTRFSISQNALYLI